MKLPKETQLKKIKVKTLKSRHEILNSLRSGKPVPF
jgi:hypothetical protein